MQRGSPYAVHRIGELKVIIGKAADKVSQTIPSERPLKIGEIKAAVVEEVKIEIVADAANVSAELHVVMSLVPGEVVLPMEGHVMQFGWTLRRRPELECVRKHDRR